jgi:hypothetical protein
METVRKVNVKPNNFNVIQIFVSQEIIAWLLTTELADYRPK